MEDSNKILAVKAMLVLCQQKLKNQQRIKAKYNWRLNARKSQHVPDGNWKIWLILAGRGFGKTRTGAETIRHWVNSGLYKRIGLIANSINDARTVMIEGESGLLSVTPPWEDTVFEPSNHLIRWEKRRALAQIFSAQTPEKLRGPQFDAIWIDELAKFKKAREVLDQATFALRLGKLPRMIITTTPRPTKVIKSLIARDDVFLTKGSTFENESNLAPQYIEQMTKRYSGTKIGAQELYAEIVEDNTAALWSWRMIENAHKVPPDMQLQQIVIGIDPAITTNNRSDETGIIVAGIDEMGRILVLEDASAKDPSDLWAAKVAQCYAKYNANAVVVEINAGGDLVEQILLATNKTMHIKKVRASNGKLVRAEPISMFYKMGKVFHNQIFTELEKQMTSYTAKPGEKSPDRLDALVWALTELTKHTNSDMDTEAWNL
ncbi:MAG: terminase family protein [Holosporales bacterium]|jgi:phage terminase large subunit-like protein|nr:terminase family protein [Holosporales bacterium]